MSETKSFFKLSLLIFLVAHLEGWYIYIYIWYIYLLKLKIIFIKLILIFKAKSSSPTPSCPSLDASKCTYQQWIVSTLNFLISGCENDENCSSGHKTKCVSDLANLYDFIKNKQSEVFDRLNRFQFYMQILIEFN